MIPGDSTPKSLPPTLLQKTPEPSAVVVPAAAPGASVPGSAAVGAGAVTAAPTVGALIHALQRRWRLAVGLALLASGLTVAAVAILFPPQYVAQCRLKLQSRPQRPVVGPDIADVTD